MFRLFNPTLPISAVLFTALLLGQGQAQTAAQTTSVTQMRVNLTTAPLLEYAEEVEEEAALNSAAPAQGLALPVRPQPARPVAAPVVVAPQSAPVAANEIVAAARATGRSMVLKATAYNSLSNQTDNTPHITATGTRTRPGVIALSRDMLRVFPYGTRVTLQDLSGRYNFSGRVFVVEDTMHIRKTNQVDIWMPTYNEAMRFGTSTVRITALR